MFIFILDGNLAICKEYVIVGIVENNVFTSSLMGTTIQGGGERERSVNHHMLLYCPSNKIKEKEKLNQRK